MSGDWIKLHRKILKHWMFEDSITLKLWINFLVDANWDRRQLRTGDWIDRGQLIIGQEKYAKSLRMTVKQLRTRLDQFRACDMVKVGRKKGVKGTVITICNYETYQDVPPAKGRDNGEITARRGRDKGEIRATEEEVKKERSKEVKKKDSVSYSVDFEEFWKAFPSGRKTAKGKAYEAFRKAVKDTDPLVIIAAAAEYGASSVGNGKYVKGPTPWLNGRCWEDDREAWGRMDENQTKAIQREVEF